MQPFLSAEKLQALPDLRAGITTRPAFRSGEGKEDFARRVPELLGLPSGLPVAIADQVHGSEVAVLGPGALTRAAGEGLLVLPETDALVTGVPRLLIGVFTADCVPVLLADPERRLIAAVHAGREGTRRHIVARTVMQLQALGSRPEALHAWVGPAICAAHYEVSPQMAADFARACRDCPEALTGPEARHLDLPAANARELLLAGLCQEAISRSPRCTFKEENLLHSYRRDGKAAGRLFSYLCMT